MDKMHNTVVTTVTNSVARRRLIGLAEMMLHRANGETRMARSNASMAAPPAGPVRLHEVKHEVPRPGPQAKASAFGSWSRRGADFNQSINSSPLIISITTAVPPCTPNAMVLLPPWCNTIRASEIGMRVAISMNEPRACADP